MIRKFTLLFVLAFVFAGVKSQDKWDLRRCVEYAIENNISVKQQDIQATVQQLIYKQSVAGQFPSLNLGSSLGLNTGRSIDRTTNQFNTGSVFFNGFSLQSNVQLFNWFSTKNTIAGNQLSVEASKASVDKLKNDISLNVAVAYLQALLGNEQVNISKIQIEQTTAQLGNTEKLVRAGSLPELNLAELQSQLAQDSLTYITAVGTETQSLLLLKSLLFLDAGAPFEIDVPPVDMIPVDPLSDLQPEMVYVLALKNLPQQRVNKLNLLAAEKFKNAARGALYPTISMGVGFQTNYSNIKSNPRFIGSSTVVDSSNIVGYIKGTTTPVVPQITTPKYNFFANPYGTQIGDNFSNNVGINISVPIFNGKQARTNFERQKLNIKSLELQQELDNMNLKQDIYKAYTDALTALQKFSAATKAVEAAEKTYSFSQKRYEVGLLNTIDLITNQNNLFRSRISKLSAQYEHVFKMKVLEYYRGEGIKLTK